MVQTSVTEQSLPISGDWTITTTQPNGAVTIQTYANGRQVATQLPHGGSITITYDAHGRPASQTDPRTGTPILAYNNRDQVTSQSAPNPLGSGSPLVTNYTFDDMGRQTGVQIPDGTWSYTVYDLRGNVTRTYGAQNYDVSYTFDPQGRMKTMVTTGQAGNSTTTWNYDAQTGRMSSKIYDNGKGTDYSYTLAGRLATRTWERGITTIYDYNAAGDLIGVDYSDSTPDVVTTFNRLGQAGTVTDGTGTRTFAYRAADLQPETETLQGDIDRIITRSYDSIRRQNGFDVGDSGDADADYSVRYGYDSIGRFNQLQQNSDTWTYARLANSHLITSLTRGSSVVNYAYVPGRDALLSIENKLGSEVISKHEYTVNAIGQRTSIKQTGSAYTAAAFNRFQYNATGELIDSKRYLGTDLTDLTNPVAPQDFEFQFDGIGNRNQTKVAQTNVTDYTSNKLNQYIAIDDGTTLQTPTTDDDGNTTLSAGKTYSWDGENRLLTVTPNTPSSGDKRIENRYDYRSRRVEKKVQNWTGTEWSTQKIERYLYDDWNLVCIYDGLSTDALVKTQTWGLDLSGGLQGAGGVSGLLAVEEIAGTHTGRYYYNYDGNGNVTQVLNNSAALVSHYEYEPFGGLIAATGDYSQANPYRFSTKLQDSETNLLYYGYRFYDPSTGRWLNRDPIEEEGGVNLYGILNNDLINRADYLGLDFIFDPSSYHLSYQTLSFSVGECGQYAWQIGFRVSPEASGQILQKIDIKSEVYTCDGKRVPDTAVEGPMNPYFRHHYLEAFGYPIPGIDGFVNPVKEECTKGSIEVTAIAVFKKDYVFGENWVVFRTWKEPPSAKYPRGRGGYIPSRNPTQSGTAPYNITDGVEILAGGDSNVLVRKFKATWNCCLDGRLSGGRKTKVTIE